MSKTYLGNEGIKQMLYDERKAFVKNEWMHYKDTGDRQHLANICEKLPFFEQPEVGLEIAKLLTQPTLSRFPKKRGLDEALRQGMLKFFYENWIGLEDDQVVYKAIADKLDWSGEGVEKRVQEAIVRLQKKGKIKTKSELLNKQNDI